MNKWFDQEHNPIAAPPQSQPGPSRGRPNPRNIARSRSPTNRADSRFARSRSPQPRPYNRSSTSRGRGRGRPTQRPTNTNNTNFEEFQEYLEFKNWQSKRKH